MPFDSNGNFSLVPGTIVSDGMTIHPSQHNPPFQDVATGLSQTLLRDGRAPWVGNQNANGHKVTGLADGTAPQDAATVGQSAFLIGDFKDSARTLDSSWLRRDGAAYNTSSYQELAALLPQQADAVVWTSINDGLPSINITSVASSINRHLAVAFDNGCLIYARDAGGGSWSLTHTIPDIIPQSISYVDGKFVILGSRQSTGVVVVFYSSDDGDTFGSPISISGDTSLVTAVAYGNGVYSAVGAGGRVLSSSDLLSWSENTSPISTNLTAITYNGTSFIAVGASGSVITSANGSSWTVRTSGATSHLLGVTSTTNRVVAVGSGGTIISSTDGATWSTATSPISVELYGVSVTEAGFLAVGDAGGAAASDNGISWVVRNSGSASVLRSVSASNPSSGEFIVVGTSGYAAIAEKTLATQFRVPNDNPTYGWIKAL